VISSRLIDQPGRVKQLEEIEDEVEVDRKDVVLLMGSKMLEHAMRFAAEVEVTRAGGIMHFPTLMVLFNMKMN
jgi:hypothetical protein